MLHMKLRLCCDTRRMIKWRILSTATSRAVVLPVERHNCIGCFANQVKLTHALVQDHDEAIKEVKLLGEHGVEASQKIVELESLCKKLREDAQKLRD
jgi:hypothetical protein